MITDKAKLAAAALFLVLTLAGLIVTLIGWRAEKEQARLQGARADRAEIALGRCEVDRNGAQAKVEQLARDIAAWKAEADRRQKAGQEAVRRAEQAAGVKLRRAQQIAARKPVGEVCEAARGLIVETLSEERQ